MNWGTNQQSWDFMTNFHDQFLDTEEKRKRWGHLAPLQRLIKTVAASERATKFRAGQSLTTLIISTTAYHGLKQDDPSVAVDIADDRVSFKVEYWKVVGSLAEERICREEEVLSVLDEFLAKLWKNTRGADIEGIA